MRDLFNSNIVSDIYNESSINHAVGERLRY